MQLRLNSADDPVAGDPERVTEDDTEYLQVPVVAGREQIYSYTDQADAYDHELLPGDELAWGVGRANSGLDIVLDHPLTQTPSGPMPTLVGNAASGTEVDDAEYRDLRMDDSETKVRGNLLLPVESRTAYGPAFTEAFDTLEDGGEWPVSLGYDVGRIDATSGRHNGQSYDAIQRQPALDHLALVMNGKARCSLEQGCAAGRANARQDDADAPSAAFGEPITTDPTMSNQQYPERDKGAIASALETIGSTFGIGVETAPRVNARSSARTPEYDDTLAEDDMGPDEYVSTHWMLDDYVRAYAEQTDEDMPADLHSPLSGGISQEAREWIASHTLLGNADAETEPNLLLFDVVSPDGVLHESKLRDVIGEDGARATLPDELREAARDEAGRLLGEEFDDGDQDGTGDDTDRENATQYSAGDIVEYTSGGRTGVVLEVYTSDFDWPAGDDEDDDLEVDASDSSPMYVIGRETGGSGLYRGSELAKGEFDEDVPDEGEIADLRQNATVPAWYADVDAGEREDAIRGNANIPGVDDPEVGFASLPEGWTRKSVLQAYASLGGSFTSCRTQMRGEIRSPTRFCAALKDEVWGSERATRMNARVEERAQIESASTSDEPADTGNGSSGLDQTETTNQDNMQDPELPDDPTDEQKIDYLVSEDGPNLDRENMEPLEGEECLDTIFSDYRRMNAEAGTEDGGETETTESTETTETTDDPGNEEGATEETADEAVVFESEEEFESAVADVVEERQNAASRDEQINRITANSEFEPDELEGMGSGGLDKLEDEHVPERENARGGQQSPRADRSAMQTEGGPRVNAGEETPDVATGGNPWEDTSGTEEADD